MTSDNRESSNNEAHERRCFEILSKRWHTLDKTRISLANTFDKYLLTFSTGSLYLSILFTNNMKKGEQIAFKWLLGLGWLLLVVSVITALLSIYFSVFAHKRQMEVTENEIDELYEKKIFCKHNYWNYVVIVAELKSISAFIIGIVLLSIFYYLNLK